MRPSPPSFDRRRFPEGSALVAHSSNAPPDTLLETWLREASEWFGDPGRRLASAPRNDQLAQIDSPLGRLVAKRERPRGRLGLRRSRTRHAFGLACALRAAGVDTAEPIAHLSLARTAHRDGHLSIALTRFVEGKTAWEWLRSSGKTELGTCIEALAQCIARLHARGFRHRDLKVPNLLFVDEPEGLRVLVIDLEAARQLGPGRLLTEAARTRDLARLLVSFESAAARRAGLPADAWARFLDRYIHHSAQHEPGSIRLDEARLWTRTRAWALRHIERNVERSRPIA